MTIDHPSTWKEFREDLPAPPELLEEYQRAMREIYLPEIRKRIADRERLAIEARRRILFIGIRSDDD